MSKFITQEDCALNCTKICTRNVWNSWYECDEARLGKRWVFILIGAICFAIALSITITLICVFKKRMIKEQKIKEQQIALQQIQTELLSQQKDIGIFQKPQIILQPATRQAEIPEFPSDIKTAQQKQSYQQNAPLVI